MRFSLLINVLIKDFIFRYNDVSFQNLEFYKRILFSLTVYVLLNIFITFFFINHVNVQLHFFIIYYDTYIFYLFFYYILQHVWVISFHKLCLYPRNHTLFFWIDLIFLLKVILIFSFFLNLRTCILLEFFYLFCVLFLIFSLNFLMFLILSPMNKLKDLYILLKFKEKHIYQFF